MNLAYPHIASRIFDTPLLISRQKAETIVSVLEPRLLGQGGELPVEAQDEDLGEGDRWCPYQLVDGIAVISVTGTLVNRSSWMDAMSGLQSYARLREQLEDAGTDPQVQGIILDVDSPGGEVAGLFDLADFVYEARSLKPIWSVANDWAFSGAYAIASSTERVYVTRTGGVGSVGVIAIHLDHSQADEAEGLKYTVFRAGEYKADLNSYEPLTDHASQSLQAELNRLHQLFAETVSRNRRMRVETILATEAQTYHGPEGVEIGFADRVGTLDDAVRDMRIELEEKANQDPWAAAGAATTTQWPPEEQEHVSMSVPRGSAAHNPSQEEDIMAEKTSDPAGTAQETAGEGNVIDLDRARSEGIAFARQTRREVRQLCDLAQRPELAEEYVDKVIDGAMSIDDVREALLEACAAREDAEAITSMHDPATATPAAHINHGEVYGSLNKYYRQAVAGR